MSYLSSFVLVACLCWLPQTLALPSAPEEDSNVMPLNIERGSQTRQQQNEEDHLPSEIWDPCIYDDTLDDEFWESVWGPSTSSQSSEQVLLSVDPPLVDLRQAPHSSQAPSFVSLVIQEHQKDQETGLVRLNRTKRASVVEAMQRYLPHNKDPKTVNNLISAGLPTLTRAQGRDLLDSNLSKSGPIFDILYECGKKELNRRRKEKKVAEREKMQKAWRQGIFKDNTLI